MSGCFLSNSHVLEFHPSAGIVVWIVSGEEESFSAEELNGFGKLRLFRLNGEGKVIFKIMARRLFIFFKELACRQRSRAPGEASRLSWTNCRCPAALLPDRHNPPAALLEFYRDAGPGV